VSPVLSDMAKLVGMSLLAAHAGAQSTYVPPKASASLLSPIRFDSAQTLDQKFHMRFDECDKHDLCDGQPLVYKCSTDPNRNTVFLKLADGTIFYDAKMGIDADGSYLAKNAPGMTDQGETSFRYPASDRPSLDADKVPFIVVPGLDFERPLGIEAGDIAAVVYEDHLAYAIIGDHGPKCKIGEGSIRLHEQVGHRGCKKRNNQGICISAEKNSIERNVLYFVFPGSKSKIIGGLAQDNINERLSDEGKKLMEGLKSAYQPPAPPTGLTASVQ
jgi:hypothetical protein